ncbi:hypothetical protein Tco_0821329 [Tanacetum coccineum]|uniref:Uncharacterized protein n=1 Tax=Tanacetum coccineum TaxID=301880 RepID=A0ABQ5ABY2_9ASTR
MWHSTYASDVKSEYFATASSGVNANMTFDLRPTKDVLPWPEVFSTDDLGLDWISAHTFLRRLQKLSSYASGHLEVSEKVACLKKASFSCTSGHVEVF